MIFDEELDKALEHIPASGYGARLDDLGIIRMLRDTRALQRTLGTKMAEDSRVATEETTFTGAAGRQ